MDFEREFARPDFLYKMVYDERNAGDDPLLEWARANKDNLFISEDDEATQRCYRKIVNWAVDVRQNFKVTAIEEFMKIADSWLIAKAMSAGFTIVTHEHYQQNCKKRVLITNVCEEFNIRYINTINLARETRAVFNLG